MGWSWAKREFVCCVYTAGTVGPVKLFGSQKMPSAAPHARDRASGFGVFPAGPQSCFSMTFPCHATFSSFGMFHCMLEV